MPRKKTPEPVRLLRRLDKLLNFSDQDQLYVFSLRDHEDVRRLWREIAIFLNPGKSK